MKQLAPFRAAVPANVDRNPVRARVSIGNGVITPHVDRHLRRSRPDDAATRQGEATTRVSFGTGFATPHVDRHLRRAARPMDGQSPSASQATRVSIGNGFISPSVVTHVKRSQARSR